MKPCLVLNGDYRILGVVPWERAVTLEFQGKAYAVKHYTEAVKTASSDSPFYQLPAVLVLKNKFVKYFRTKVKLKKKNVFIRDHYKCAYCGNQFKKDELTIDHVHPQSKGGKSTWENLVSACQRCNRKKGDGNSMKPLWKPYEPKNNQIFIVDRMQPEWKDYIYEVQK